MYYCTTNVLVWKKSQLFLFLQPSAFFVLFKHSWSVSSTNWGLSFKYCFLIAFPSLKNCDKYQTLFSSLSDCTVSFPVGSVIHCNKLHDISQCLVFSWLGRLPWHCSPCFCLEQCDSFACSGFACSPYRWHLLFQLCNSFFYTNLANKWL